MRSKPERKDGTRVDAVMQTIREQLASRALVPGERLPSIRQMAERLDVAKNTVVEAYDRLAADGVLTAKRGSGFYVCGHLPPLSLTDAKTTRDRSIDPLWIIRQSLEAESDMLRPGCGWLPPSWLPDEEIRRTLRRVSKEQQTSLLEYGHPYGHLALREQLSRRLGERGVAATSRQIILADSGTQAIDLICRFLLEPGDTVLIDDPGYFNFQALLRAHRVQLVAVPYTEQGPDVGAMEKLLAQHKPRLYLTNTVFHNPTGAVLSPIVAHRVLKLAEDHDLLIIEDDIYAEFAQNTSPLLASFDGLNRVVHVGSFSKVLTASARCGYIAVRPDWAEAIVDLKLATTLSSNGLGAELVYSMLRQGAYRHHVDALRGRLADAMGRTLHRLDKLGIAPWMKPQGGMFLWVCLPQGLDSAKVSRKALRDGVVLAPGNVFSLSQTASPFMRFNVAQCQPPKVFEVLERAME
ncbi:MAG: PLP-dependent aminotransferase family protein [Gallionella sp.]|jgi:DNA-binding transcriptional MocR family regulator|nr:PLP-dependent aminotransferase family protein [Gallionella sp.]MCK9355186.1 PLP-dependent aminotransferase family protein [Gallionella sp.]